MDLFGVTTPTASDPATYTFEKGTDKPGGKGFADVWHFAGEYTGYHAELDAAYRQLHPPTG